MKISEPEMRFLETNKAYEEQRKADFLSTAVSIEQNKPKVCFRFKNFFGSVFK